MRTNEFQFAVLNTMAPDRIGVIAGVTDFLRRRGANLHSVLASKLGRVFCLNALFRVARGGLARIKNEYKVELAEFSPTLIETTEPTVFRDPEALHYALTVYAFDQQGILANLTQLMAEQGASIVKLASGTYPAPHFGTPLFAVELTLDVPNSIAVRNIRKGLLELERHLGWDIDFRPEPRAPLEVSQHAPYPPSDRMRHAVIPTDPVPQESDN
jgi:glycine cleavage system transcriptional repressor